MLKVGISLEATEYQIKTNHSNPSLKLAQWWLTNGLWSPYFWWSCLRKSSSHACIVPGANTLAQVPAVITVPIPSHWNIPCRASFLPPLPSTWVCPLSRSFIILKFEILSLAISLSSHPTHFFFEHSLCARLAREQGAKQASSLFSQS